MMLWFLDKDTNAKVKIEHDEVEFLRLMGLNAAQLPSLMAGGLDAVEPQLHSDSNSRMTRLIRDGIYGGRGAASKLQEQLLVPKRRKILPNNKGANAQHESESSW